MEASAKNAVDKPGEEDESEEDDDYVPVDDDEDAAEDDAYEALAGGDDPDDPGARHPNEACLWRTPARGGAAVRPRRVQRAALPPVFVCAPVCWCRACVTACGSACSRRLP